MFSRRDFLVRAGQTGWALSLFGRRPEVHRLLSEHLTAEYHVRTEGRGRTVDEWKPRLAGADNHWLHCVVKAAVAASMLGAVLFGTDVKPVRRKQVSLVELQRQARMQRQCRDHRDLRTVSGHHPDGTCIAG